LSSADIFQTRGGSWALAAGPFPSPWIFMYGTDIVDRGLIVLFFDLLLFFSLFTVGPSPGRGSILLFFDLFAIFRAFIRCPLPLEIFLPTPLEEEGRFFRCGRPQFLVQKTSNFSKFMVSPHGQGGLSQCGHIRTRGEESIFVGTSFMDGPLERLPRSR